MPEDLVRHVFHGTGKMDYFKFYPKFGAGHVSYQSSTDAIAAFLTCHGSHLPGNSRLLMEFAQYLPFVNPNINEHATVEDRVIPRCYLKAVPRTAAPGQCDIVTGLSDELFQQWILWAREMRNNLDIPIDFYDTEILYVYNVLRFNYGYELAFPLALNAYVRCHRDIEKVVTILQTSSTEEVEAIVADIKPEEAAALEEALRFRGTFVGTLSETMKWAFSGQKAYIAMAVVGSVFVVFAAIFTQLVYGEALRKGQL
jgi:hypothetical protein